MGSIMYQGASPKIMYQGVEYGASGGNGVIEIYELKTYDLAGYTVTMTHTDGTTITKSVTTSPQTLEFEIGTPGEWTISNSKDDFIRVVDIGVVNDFYNGNVLYLWDFTQSLVDEKQQVAVVLNHCTRDEHGIYLNAANSCVKVPVPISKGRRLDIKFGTMDKQFGINNGRLITGFSSNYQDSGFMVQNGQYYSIYNDDEWPYWANDSNLLYDAFSDAKLSMINLNGFTFYKNDLLVYEPNINMIDVSSNGFYLGSNKGLSFYNAYIESMAIISLT